MASHRSNENLGTHFFYIHCVVGSKILITKNLQGLTDLKFQENRMMLIQFLVVLGCYLGK
jgi:hypothetical protein